MKTSLMKRPVFFAIAATLAGGVACGATTYSLLDDRVLEISVPAGEINSVDAAQLESADSNGVTNIVKVGLGAFKMDDKTAIPNYEGDIHVKEGTWIVACTNALGKLSSNVDGSGVGGVFVTDGGTLEIGGTDPIIKNDGKKISIEGTGVDGNGALVITSTSGDVKNTLGKNISLTGDATIGMMSKVNVYLYGAAISLNGHKLSIAKHITSQNVLVFNGNTAKCNIQGPGEVKFPGKSFISFEGGVSMLGNDGTITFVDESRFKSNGMRGRYEWPMVWDSTGIISMTRQTTSDVVTNRNTWHGPVRLDKNMKVSFSSSGTFGLMGPVSGNGGLDIYWGASGKPEVPTNFVNLGNANSEFTGGVRVQDLVVNVMENGAVPADGGVFALTNSIVNFEPLKNYMLPDGIIHVDDGDERSVNGGMGKWKTLVKTGAGTVNYDSAIGAEELDLREGVLKVSLNQSMFAGLIEGVEHFGGQADCLDSITNMAMVAYTNGIVMSPYLVNTKMGTYWTAKRPAWDTEGNIKANGTVYSGYIWNRDPTNVMWTFAGNVATRTYFYFDNVLQFENISSQGEVDKTTVEVTPGPHHFRIANCGNIKSTGPEGGISTKNKEWNNLGFRYDPYGRDDTTITNNFVILEDPGDGSLFTWAIPGEDVFYPGADESTKLGKFQRVKFSGGTLHLNGTTNWITAVEGLPSVAGSGKIFIENKWTVDAADIGSASNASGVSFGFGADAELEIENPLAAKSATGSREWTVMESAEDITGSIAIKDEITANRWTVTVDGNRLKLKYRPLGTAITVR